MSLGSPALGSSLTLALKVRSHPGTPSALSRQEELFRDVVEEEEEMDDAENNDADQTKDRTGHHALFGMSPGKT